MEASSCSFFFCVLIICPTLRLEKDGATHHGNHHRTSQTIRKHGRGDHRPVAGQGRPSRQKGRLSCRIDHRQNRFGAGRTVLAIYAEEKSTVPHGYALCAIGAAGEAAPDVAAANEAKVAAHLKATAGGIDLGDFASKAPAAEEKPSFRAAPAAKVFARQQGVELADVAAFCKRDMIHRKDVPARRPPRRKPNRPLPQPSPLRRPPPRRRRRSSSIRSAARRAASPSSRVRRAASASPSPAVSRRTARRSPSTTAPIRTPPPNWRTNSAPPEPPAKPSRRISPRRKAIPPRNLSTPSLSNSDASTFSSTTRESSMTRPSPSCRTNSGPTR